MAFRMMAKQALLGALAITLVAGAAAAPAAAAPGDGPRSTFIVVLHDHVDSHAAGRDMARRYNGELRFVYEHALRGFSIRVPESAAGGIARDRRVTSVERDQVVRTTAINPEVPTGVERVYADDNTKIGIGTGAKVDVDIAIIDTGLDSDHPDLNIAGGTNCSGGGPFKQSCSDGTFEDSDGHGTHVGGTAAALDNGIGVVGMAPGARLWGVKVLSDSGSGYMSWITAGIDWVTKNGDIEVANMSLGCECTSTAMNTAISNSVAAGTTYVVAAGNSDKDTATFSPANHSDVIAVSALADFDGLAGGVVTSVTSPPYCRVDQDDTLADFSNWGAKVAIAAPGVCILSTWPGGGYDTISGTSMASPHVAGAAALLASSRPTATPAQVEELLVNNGNYDWTDDSGDKSKEPLLDVRSTTVFAPKMLSTGGGTAPTNSPPTASFTYSCTDLACSFNGSGSSDDTGITSYTWNFGDGTSGSGATTTRTYAAAGTYTVTLTVTDADNATDADMQSVPVTEPSTSGITLNVTGYKVKGVQHAEVDWGGASKVDIWRDTTQIADGTIADPVTDNIGQKGGGSYTYKVCDDAILTKCATAVITF